MATYSTALVQKSGHLKCYLAFKLPSTICNSRQLQTMSLKMLVPVNQTQKIKSARLISSAMDYNSIPTENTTDVSQMKTKTTHVKSMDLDAKSSLKFKCPHCQFLDADKDSVKRHIVSEHKLKPFGCPHCNEGFTNMKTMNKHIQDTHPNEKRVKEPYAQIITNETEPKKKQSKKKKPITENVPKTPKSKQISSESSKSTEKENSHSFLTPNNEIVINQSKPLEVQHSTKVTTTSEKLHLSSKTCSGNESKTELNLKPTPTYNLRDAITDFTGQNMLKAIDVYYPMKSASISGSLEDSKYHSYPYRNFTKLLTQTDQHLSQERIIPSIYSSKYMDVLYPMKFVQFSGSLDDAQYLLKPYQNFQKLATEQKIPVSIDKVEQNGEASEDSKQHSFESKTQLKPEETKAQLISELHDQRNTNTSINPKNSDNLQIKVKEVLKEDGMINQSYQSSEKEKQSSKVHARIESNDHVVEKIIKFITNIIKKITK